jgi:hypothetical protein
MWNWPAYTSSSSTSNFDSSTSTCGYNYYTFYSANEIKWTTETIKVKEPDPPKELFFDPKNLW